MLQYEAYIWLAGVVQLVFVFAFGACAGSLINVLVYRLPRGMNVVVPASRCPRCQTKLKWKDNIPVLGWILLKGRCRYCGKPISPEYPIVESLVGLLFVLFYVLWYLAPGSSFLGLDWAGAQPEWAANGLPRTWPVFVVVLILIGSLVAMTLVDARTYTIPLSLTIAPVVVAIVAHPAHALWVQLSTGQLRHAVGLWSIPTPSHTGWTWIGAAAGGAAGLVVSNALLGLGLLRRSFADYPEWEKNALAAQERQEDSTALPVEPAPPPPAEPAAPVGGALQDDNGHPENPERARPVTAATPADAAQSSPDLWIQYPHARREVLLEVLFLGPCIAFGALGAGLFPGWFGSSGAPLWVCVLAGVILGYLAGGGLVWAVRILGSLAFGKEAMGLGDVHLMAAVGACLGWIDPTIAFFGAAFLGVFWAILGRIVGGAFQRALPYGPFLAAATVLVLLAKPLVETGLGLLVGRAINIP